MPRPARMVLVTAVLALAGGCGAPDDPVTSAPAPETTGGPDGAVEAELVASEQTRPDSNRANHAELATSADEAAAAWRHFNLAGGPPQVDFAESGLLFLSGGESTGCPLEPTGLRIDLDAGEVVATVADRGDEECPSDALPRTFVYRVRQADLPPTPFSAGIESHRLLPVS